MGIQIFCLKVDGGLLKVFLGFVSKLSYAIYRCRFVIYCPKEEERIVSRQSRIFTQEFDRIDNHPNSFHQVKSQVQQV